MPTYPDRAAAVEARRRAVFCDWLKELPPAGWSGTAGELADEWAEFLAGRAERFGTYFPADRGVARWLRAVEAEIGAAGRRLTFARSKHERRITIA